LITTDGGLVSIDTDPNVVIVDNISCIFALFLYFKLSCCRHPSSDKDNQAQIVSVMQHLTVKSINDIQLTLHTTFNITKGKDNIEIRGCIVCSNGKMIFVDRSNNKLVILNDDGTLYKVDGTSVIVCLIYFVSTCCYIGMVRQATLLN
jgi:hypothetical protein